MTCGESTVLLLLLAEKRAGVDIWSARTRALAKRLESISLQDLRSYGIRTRLTRLCSFTASGFSK